MHVCVIYIAIVAIYFYSSNLGLFGKIITECNIKSWLTMNAISNKWWDDVYDVYDFHELIAI